MSVQELNADKGWLRWKATATEWLSVIIACTSLILSLLSVIVAIHANIRTDYQDQHIADLKDSVGVLRIRQAKMDAHLKAHGVPVEEIYDDTSR